MELVGWGGWVRVEVGRKDPRVGCVVLAVEGESESEGRGESEGECGCAYDEWGFTWAYMVRTWFKHASGSWVTRQQCGAG
jgi:hypothetical protein